jgi:hypothetical protein
MVSGDTESYKKKGPQSGSIGNVGQTEYKYQSVLAGEKPRENFFRFSGLSAFLSQRRWLRAIRGDEARRLSRGEGNGDIQDSDGIPYATFPPAVAGGALPADKVALAATASDISPAPAIDDHVADPVVPREELGSSCVAFVRIAPGFQQFAPFVQLLAQQLSWDHLRFVLSDQRRRQVPAEGIFDDFIVFRPAK